MAQGLGSPGLENFLGSWGHPGLCSSAFSNYLPFFKKKNFKALHKLLLCFWNTTHPWFCQGWSWRRDQTQFSGNMKWNFSDGTETFQCKPKDGTEVFNPSPFPTQPRLDLGSISYAGGVAPCPVTWWFSAALPDDHPSLIVLSWVLTVSDAVPMVPPEPHFLPISL